MAIVPAAACVWSAVLTVTASIWPCIWSNILRKSAEASWPRQLLRRRAEILGINVAQRNHVLAFARRVAPPRPATPITAMFNFSLGDRLWASRHDKGCRRARGRRSAQKLSPIDLVSSAHHCFSLHWILTALTSYSPQSRQNSD